MNRTSDPESIESRYRRCTEQLAARGQDHVLRWWDDLGASQREHLLGEIDSIPWSHLDPLIETHVRNRPQDEVLANLKPATVYPRRADGDNATLYRDATVLGDELIRAGKVAAFTVAGGQGTRLGFDGPKGAVPISPVREKTLFQLFAETIMAVRKRSGADVRWYIMTNPADHQQTVEFLKAHEYYGLPEDDVVLFSQGMQGLWPSEERCAGCGDCVLHLTGGICPITTCTKSLLNGMCGGQRDGKCEVDSDRDCGWYLIYNRLKELGRLDNLRKLPPLRDFRKLEVPGNERGTTRWALEKPEIYEATDLASVE